MMETWEETPATRIIGVLARLRRLNLAIQLGGQWPIVVEGDLYVYLRRYRDSRCLVVINRGEEDREVDLVNLDYPDGKHRCLLSGAEIEILDGNLATTVPARGARVFARRGSRIRAATVIRLQVNGAPTQPGDRVLVIGDCEELGKWDIREGIELECINSNTWFGELPFDANAGKTIGYKLVVISPSDPAPRRENRVVRRRLVIPDGFAKWRDRWEE
jgi:cyclomaltodextrin glucanotransferase